MTLLSFFTVHTLSNTQDASQRTLNDGLLHCLTTKLPSSRYMLSPVRLSVCLSVTREDQSKTVEVGIMQFSPYGRPTSNNGPPAIFLALNVSISKKVVQRYY